MEKPKTRKPIKPKLTGLKSISRHEESMKLQLMAEKIDFVREHQFHETRKWRFDFALLSIKIGIECEGGIWAKEGGRHNRGSGYQADLEKYNAATADGWCVLRFTEKHIQSGLAIHTIIEAMNKRLPENEHRKVPPLPCRQRAPRLQSSMLPRKISAKPAKPKPKARRASKVATKR